jgi:hypothetical protein
MTMLRMGGRYMAHQIALLYQGLRSVPGPDAPRPLSPHTHPVPSRPTRTPSPLAPHAPRPLSPRPSHPAAAGLCRASRAVPAPSTRAPPCHALSDRVARGRGGVRVTRDAARAGSAPGFKTLPYKKRIEQQARPGPARH